MPPNALNCVSGRGVDGGLADAAAGTSAMSIVWRVQVCSDESTTRANLATSASVTVLAVVTGSG